MLQYDDESIVGKSLGQPIWLQDDDTPTCCNKTMQFILQVDSGEELNFGDFGTGYIFSCNECRGGKFLFQCH